MVSAIRDLESGMGTDEKLIARSEEDARYRARRSIYARKPIKKGETLTDDNLILLRPMAGLSPASYPGLMGKKALSDIDELAPITEDLVEG